MSKKQRSVLLAVMTLVLCLALIAGGSYALFTDEAMLDNHLVAGTMDITLTRTDLVTYTYEGVKSVENGDYEDDVDFSDVGSNGENVFGLRSEDLIVPDTKYVATMTIANNTEKHKSDVAFSYWIKIAIDGEDAAKALAGQLRVTVKQGADYEESVLLSEADSDGFFVGGESRPVGILPKDTAQDFTVTLEFLDLDVNNEAKSQELDFDLIVYAVQLANTQNP